MDLLIARNPEDSTLPFILLIPIDGGIVLRAKETWPRTAKIYCHRHGLPWPDDPDIVDRIPLRSCVRRGAAISIEADRTRESRSQFVITQARGREMIFWQNARTTKAARPNVALPTARASGLAHPHRAPGHAGPRTHHHLPASQRGPGRPTGHGAPASATHGGPRGDCPRRVFHQ